MNDETSHSESRQLLSPEDVLERMPQKPPFLFIDQILELSEHTIYARYRFKEDEYFYKGHFPGDPVTPGVILVEAMAQTGLVALGLYLLFQESPKAQLRTLFSECEVEFSEMVRPGETVFMRGERIFWRRNKLKSKVELSLEDGRVAASGVVAGVGVVLP